MITISDIFVESALPAGEVWRRLQALQGDWTARPTVHQYPPKIGFQLDRRGGVGIPGDVIPKGDGSVVRLGTAPGVAGAIFWTVLLAAFAFFMLPRATGREHPLASTAAVAAVFAINWTRARRAAAQHAEGVALVRSLAR